MVACVRIHAHTKHLMLHLVERPPNVHCTTRSKIERKKTSNEEKKKEQMNRKEVEKSGMYPTANSINRTFIYTRLQMCENAPSNPIRPTE